MNNKTLNAIFWILVALGLGIIGWKFLGSEDQQMETKILFVFSTFVVWALSFRWVRNQASDERLKKWNEEMIEWADTGISAVILAFVIMSFIVQAFKIPSGSMTPTLLIGDHLFVNKFYYGTQVPFTQKKLWQLKAVKRYDVVVFQCPQEALSEAERKAGIKKDFIKRAIGLPGDKIEIKNKVLFINGQKADDSHGYFLTGSTFDVSNLGASRDEYQHSWEKGNFVYFPPEAIRDNFGPILVPDHHYFVMGDNRDGSFDSRYWGPLDDALLKGKAWLVYWPFNRAKLIQ